MEKIVNCRFEASNSVKSGGLGLRNATNLCYSSFLGSIHAVAELIVDILLPHIPPTDDLIQEALPTWKTINESEPLHNEDLKFRNRWDKAICVKQHQRVLEKSETETNKARIFANVSNERERCLMFSLLQHWALS